MTKGIFIVQSSTEAIFLKGTWVPILKMLWDAQWRANRFSLVYPVVDFFLCHAKPPKTPSGCDSHFCAQNK